MLAARAASASASARKERLQAIVRAVQAAPAAGAAAGTRAAALATEVARRQLHALTLEQALQQDAPAPAAAAELGVLQSLELFVPAAGVGGPKESALAQLPPPMESVAARPVFLDTAASFVAYPSLDAVVRPKGAQSGLRGVVSSLFGGWRK